MAQVTVTNLNRNPGILPFKLGNAKIKVKSHIFLHYFDMKPIRDEIKILKYQYRKVSLSIKTNLTHPYFFELDNFNRALLFQLNSAEQKFNSLNPHHRVKRGLINGLGSVIKTITGNLDANDAIRFDQAIKDLETNQEHIISKFNKEISLTGKVIENFSNITNLIKHNQDAIAAGLNKVNSQLNRLIFDFDDYLQIRNILDQINVTLNIILQLLNDVENAITFARLGTLHGSIIKIEEIESIIHTVLKYYSKDELIFQNLLNQTHNYYNIIKVQAYFSETKVVFVLNFPIVHPKTFNYYHLYSIPNSDNTVIVPPNTYLVTNEDYYQYESLPCDHMESIYYCPREYLVKELTTPDCIVRLLQLSTSTMPNNCHLASIHIRDTIIHQINPAYYLCMFRNATKIKLTCRNTDFTILRGNFLIHLPTGCSFQYDGSSPYQNGQEVTKGQPLLLPEMKVSGDRSSFKLTKKIVLKEAKLDRIHQLEKEQDDIEPLTRMVTHPPAINQYMTIPIYIIFLTVVVWYIIRHCLRRWHQPSTVVYTTSSNGNSEAAQPQPQPAPSGAAQPPAFFTPEK